MGVIRLRKCLWVLLASQCLMLQAQATMMLKTDLNVMVNQAKIQAFETTWHFDQTASQSLLVAFDQNRDGQFREQEKRDLIRMLSQFAPQDYFLLVYQGEALLALDSMHVIGLSSYDNLVSVTFGVQLNEKVNLQTHTLSVAFVGNEAIRFDQGASRANISGMLAQNCKVTLLEQPSSLPKAWQQISCTK